MLEEQGQRKDGSQCLLVPWADTVLSFSPHNQ